MKTEKMSLAKIQGKLSRVEMRNIMAGSGGGKCVSCKTSKDCSSSQICTHYTGTGPCGEGDWCL